jgi:hypothetical protein
MCEAKRDLSFRKHPFLFPVVSLSLLLFLAVLIACVPESREEGTVSTSSGQESPSIEGRWVRPDGGYILTVELREGDAPPEVAYYNPRPIQIANARLTQRGSSLRLFVEMQDRGYPGSYYDLSYDSDSDRLHGIYYQAMQKREYHVVFVRESRSGFEPR